MVWFKRAVAAREEPLHAEAGAPSIELKQVNFSPLRLAFRKAGT